jgi:hypothetical protein
MSNRKYEEILFVLKNIKDNMYKLFEIDSTNLAMKNKPCNEKQFRKKNIYSELYWGQRHS